nr:15339_t:CDS:2 [Entrophospora candida]
MSTTNNPNSPTTDANFIINSNHIHYEMIGNDNSVNYINNLNSTGIADFNIINVNDNLVASHKLNQQTIIQNNFFSACHQNSSASDIYALVKGNQNQLSLNINNDDNISNDDSIVEDSKIIVPAQHHQQPIESINNDNDISIIIPRKGHTRKRSLSAPTIPSEMQDIPIQRNPKNLTQPSKPPMSSEEYRHKLNEELEKVDFSDITVSELKNLLRQRNKPATGKKAILMQRLQEEVTLDEEMSNVNNSGDVAVVNGYDTYHQQPSSAPSMMTEFNNNYGFINHQISNKNSLSSMDDGNDDSQMMMSNDPNDPTSPVSTASLLLNDPLRMFVSSPLQHFYNEEEAFQFIFNQNQQQQISQDDGNMMNIKTEDNLGYFTTPYTLTQQVEDIVMVGEQEENEEDYEEDNQEENGEKDEIQGLKHYNIRRFIRNPNGKNNLKQSRK